MVTQETRIQNACRGSMTWQVRDTGSHICWSLPASAAVGAPAPAASVAEEALSGRAARSSVRRSGASAKARANPAPTAAEGALSA